uniref:beta-N-acetylhexosaminidase n=1 Tax=mine drainage metagenome TaxID=410659 RepID=E6QLE0_9ZZZZ
MKIRVFIALLLLALTASAAPPPHLNRSGDRWARATLRKMSLQEKIGQMILVWARVRFLNSRSPEYLRLRQEIRRYHVGSFGVTIAVEHGHLVKNQPLEAAMLTNRLQRDSKYPLLFAADFERGLSMRLNGATAFPAAMAFGAARDPQLARQFGRISALESRAIGIHWNWFPIADINSNPANPIINTRSFGADPALVSAMVTAYIAGAHSAGLLTTAKHFPGHGDTDTDSHLALARVNAPLDRLNALELAPFRAAIAAGVDSIMIGHLTVPAIEPDPDRPASISHRIVTDLLQQQLGFHGLVVTDALDMGALTQVFPGNKAQVSAAEAVQAVLAGNDMVIIPADLDGAYNGLLHAVQSGLISRQRIDRSVLKILRLKASLGLNRKRFVSLDQVPELVAQPDSLDLAQQVSDRAITLVRDTTHQLPLAATSQAAPVAPVAIVLTDNARFTEGGQQFLQSLHERAPNATSFLADADNVDALAPQILDAIAHATRVLVLAESFPSAGRVVQGKATGSAGLDPGPQQLLARVLAAANPRTILIAFGNPYIGSSFPDVATYLCTFSNTPGSATAAVRAIFGEIPITGQLPVEIPGIGARNSGIQLPATHTPPTQTIQ